MQSGSGFEVLIGVPFIAFLIAGVLRLDERMVTPRGRRGRRAGRARFSEVVGDGDVLLADPDGRAVTEQRHK
jgi:hypothetical protein